MPCTQHSSMRCRFLRDISSPSRMDGRTTWWRHATSAQQHPMRFLTSPLATIFCITRFLHSGALEMRLYEGLQTRLDCDIFSEIFQCGLMAACQALVFCGPPLSEIAERLGKSSSTLRLDFPTTRPMALPDATQSTQRWSSIHRLDEPALAMLPRTFPGSKPCHPFYPEPFPSTRENLFILGITRSPFGPSLASRPPSFVLACYFPVPSATTRPSLRDGIGSSLALFAMFRTHGGISGLLFLNLRWAY
ncbi:hypothetical protein QBC35DRAFT_203063 [Podospora australis]|uniref:Uncharacterized protein n=1 Tax=Podospora australis TaxID=1536484 RepID=A0AAN6X2H4_9PEZI|nr:hypothetical protein QBC35DRAFT_203063 [Podospora australis]